MPGGAVVFACTFPNALCSPGAQKAALHDRGVQRRVGGPGSPLKDSRAFLPGLVAAYAGVGSCQDSGCELCLAPPFSFRMG